MHTEVAFIDRFYGVQGKFQDFREMKHRRAEPHTKYMEVTKEADGV